MMPLNTSEVNLQKDQIIMNIAQNTHESHRYHFYTVNFILTSEDETC